MNWKTQPYDVALDDGRTKSIYAASEDEAVERFNRHFERLGSPVRAVTAVPFRPPRRLRRA